MHARPMPTAWKREDVVRCRYACFDTERHGAECPPCLHIMAYQNMGTKWSDVPSFLHSMSRQNKDKNRECHDHLVLRRILLIHEMQDLLFISRCL